MSRPHASTARTGLGRSRLTGNVFGRHLAPRGLAAVLLLAAPVSAAPASLYPPASAFRSLQLITLACGRDNDSASCDRARALADPLLDHPRLSASCKDSLWAIRQRAVTASSNSPERRDAIDRAAKDVTVFCRQPSRPLSGSGSGAGTGGSAGGGGSSFSAPSPR